ncbi:GH92 family glycosyl hydrolase [Desulfosarcina sp.]|nr:GH92 family glycosyl hydrolase [Desulfosarcina sp.]
MNKQKRSLLFSFVALCFGLISCSNNGSQLKKPDNLTKYVDPFVGTHDSRPMQFPGPAMPFGMVKLSPDNEESDWKAGHDYNIDNIAGFNFIHDYHITGFYALPVIGEIQTQPGSEENPNGGYRSKISPEEQKAWPGYYSVTLEDYNIFAELSATIRVGIQRYTFPKSDKAAIMFDFEIPYENQAQVLDVHVKKVSNIEIEGYIKFFDQTAPRTTIWLENDYIIHFVTRTDKPYLEMGGWINDSLLNNINEINGKPDVGCFLNFNTKEGEHINIHTAISMVSIEQARLNLNTETKDHGFDFDSYVTNAQNTWNEWLGKFVIEDENEENKKKFYTNLYRTYCTRTIWSDVNGKWVDMNEDIVQSPNNEPVYGCDAFWGMKWNLNGQWSLVNPSLMNSWVKSLLKIYERGGWLPKGPTAGEYTAIMTSSPAVSLIVAACQQGIRDYDVELAYEAISSIMKEQGVVHKSGGFVGNRWLQPYMDYGYIPYEHGPASVTMEMAFQDWCVAQMALGLGKTEDYNFFMERSACYNNLFDPEVKYARTKSSTGEWIEPFEEFTSDGFIEGNPWQYTFYAPHDVQNVINFLGKEEFITRLDWGFEASIESKFNATGDNYAKYPINHGNQPNMQAAFLFNYAGEPWKTQKWTREIIDEYYGMTPQDGWPGDEDQGQMGSWLVMSSLGLFQMQGGCGIEPVYDLTSPLFKKATISLENGETLTIIANNNSDKNKYIQSAKLNGIPLSNSWIYSKDIQHGGELEYLMGPQPNKDWGVEELPPSVSKQGTWEKPNPGLSMEASGLKDERKKTFLDKLSVSIQSYYKNGIVRYTTDGQSPTKSSKDYSRPIEIEKTTEIKAAVFDKNGKQLSKLRSAFYTKLDYNKNLATGSKATASKYTLDYSPDFAVDGFVDKDHYWDASPYPQWWQTELPEPKDISKVQIFPYWDGYRYYQYTIEVSSDAKAWKKIVDASENVALSTELGYTHKFEPIVTKYIRVNFLFNNANEGVHLIELRAW